MADKFSDTSLPGVQDIIRRVAASNGTAMTADDLVDHCLDLMGPLSVKDKTRQELIDYVTGEGGSISWQSPEDFANASRVTSKVLALISGTKGVPVWVSDNPVQPLVGAIRESPLPETPPFVIPT